MKVFIEKISDTIMYTCKAQPLAPIPQRTCQHDSACMTGQLQIANFFI